MAKEGRSHIHKSPSYKVHDHPHTHRNIYIYIYTHTSCIMLSHRVGKVIQTLPTFQEYGLARYRKCKTNIAIPKERGPSKKQEK